MNTMSESAMASAILSRSSSAARWPIEASPPGAETARDLVADADLVGRVRLQQRLRVRVAGDELDAHHLGPDHPVDGVAAAAADADDADEGEVLGIGPQRHRRSPRVAQGVGSGRVTARPPGADPDSGAASSPRVCAEYTRGAWQVGIPVSARQTGGRARLRTPSGAGGGGRGVTRATGRCCGSRPGSARSRRRRARTRSGSARPRPARRRPSGAARPRWRTTDPGSCPPARRSPDGAATRTGISSTSRPSSAVPASCAPPPVRMIPAGSIPCPLRAISLLSISNVSRIRASMIRHSSSRLTVRPASSPRTETPISSSSMLRRSQVPWRTLSSSATWSVVLTPIATSLVTLLPPTGSTDVWNGEPSANSARSIVPAPMSATATPSSFSVSVSTASADASALTTSSSILTPAGLDALGQVLDGGRGRGDDVRLHLEPQRAHPERVLDALLAVDREVAALDVEHVPVGRDGHGTGHLDRPVDVLAGDLAVVGGDGDLSGGVQALDVAPRRRRRTRGRSSSRTAARTARRRRRSTAPSGRC